MFRHSLLVAIASVSLASLAASAGAQNFLSTLPRTIPEGNFELSGYPAYLVGRDDAPNRFGAAGRVGYGITDWLDLSAKGGAFDDFSLAGLEAGFWFLKGSDVDMMLTVGAHKAFIEDTNDTTAFDLGLQAGGRIGDRLTLTGGLTASFEQIDDLPDDAADSDFTRVYLGPGLRYRLSDRWDVHTQVGIGLTDESPHYITFGVSAYLPTGGASSRPGSR
jgi:hypothetical protein